jgi:hypothetical protein
VCEEIAAAAAKTLAAAIAMKFHLIFIYHQKVLQINTLGMTYPLN